jgi:hypothetical protein
MLFSAGSYMHVGFEVLTAATTRSELEVHRRFGITYRHNLYGRSHERNTLDEFFLLVSFLAHSSTFMIEMICSSETSMDLCRTTRHYNA